MTDRRALQLFDVGEAALLWLAVGIMFTALPAGCFAAWWLTCES